MTWKLYVRYFIPTLVLDHAYKSNVNVEEYTNTCIHMTTIFVLKMKACENIFVYDIEDVLEDYVLCRTSKE